MLKSTMCNSTSYARVTSPNETDSNQDDQDFRDLLLLSTPDKAGVGLGSGLSKTSIDMAVRNVCGLLEVEPLHFICHSTSDATKLERADSGNDFSLYCSDSLVCGQAVLSTLIDYT